MASGNKSGWSKFTSTGLELAAGIGLGVAVGYWIDLKRNTGPWGLLVGVCVGFAAGMYLLIKDAMRANKD